jgi:hypothetical protein
VVSIYASHPDVSTGGWTRLDGVGHTDADMQAGLDLPPVDERDAAAMAGAPRLIYRFATQRPDRDYSFPNYVTDEVATLRAVALPLLPATKTGRMRIAVRIDSGPVRLLDFAAPYYGARWRQNVLDNAAFAEISDLPLKPGSHVLEVRALDPGVTLDRFEISFTGAGKAYGPIPETRVIPLSSRARAGSKVPR